MSRLRKYVSQKCFSESVEGTWSYRARAANNLEPYASGEVWIEVDFQASVAVTPQTQYSPEEYSISNVVIEDVYLRGIIFDDSCPFPHGEVVFEEPVKMFDKHFDYSKMPAVCADMVAVIENLTLGEVQEAIETRNPYAVNE